MIANTHRFYQLSNFSLLEYEINEKYSEENITEGEWYTHHKMSEFCPYVYTLATGDKLYVEAKIADDLTTNNDVYGATIAYDYKDITQYYIKDASVTYSDYDKANNIFRNIDDSSYSGKMYNLDNETITFDKVRVYYTNGYYFDEVEGFYLNVYVNTDDAHFLSLYRKYIPKGRVAKLFNYLERPLFISNRIYDKYIEFCVPSVKYLCSPLYKTNYSFVGDMNVSSITPLKIEYCEIESSEIVDYDKSNTAEYDITGALKGAPALNYDALLMTKERSSTCALPQSANSDRLTAHIELSDSSTTVSFCGMWDDEKLSNEIVNSFNSKILLYDLGKNVRKNVNLYEPDVNKIEWIAYHEVYAKFYNSDSDVTDGNTIPEVLYTQTYNFTQTFGSSIKTDVSDIKYKPVISKDVSVNTVVFEYTLRLINLYDDVQFLRSATLSVSGNDVYRLMNGSLSIGEDIISKIKNYTIYNKIENKTQEITTPAGNPYTTQYTKVFYNSNEIVLDENGEYYGDEQYTMTLSNSPKNYKFTFRKYDKDNNLMIYDLSDMTLILYSRDSDGTDIIIDATYSSNMNSALGEVEFYISTNNVLKLKNVSTDNRFLSIMVVNNDNSKYSMFDFSYS